MIAYPESVVPDDKTIDDELFFIRFQMLISHFLSAAFLLIESTSAMKKAPISREVIRLALVLYGCYIFISISLINVALRKYVVDNYTNYAAMVVSVFIEAEIDAFIGYMAMTCIYLSVRCFIKQKLLIEGWY